MIRLVVCCILYSIFCCCDALQQQQFTAAQSRIHSVRMRINMISLADINDRILMENAERIGRKEQSLVGSKSPLTTMNLVLEKS